MDEVGFFNAISEWKTARYEKKIAEMKEQGKCPDCRGRGFNPVMLPEFYYMNNYDCPGCNGSGLFSDWAQGNERYT
ncbi:hypothetical protein HMPREF0083_04432 [Aneurinibacillus aneurinilyticus ATCC 12856]|uniref:Methionine aminopeptidase n=1 Tax=Aneurinibacillus aneurinilyticus ATCC 12856 TaxID=649747 RepID=U1WYX8_ANEAE|nr:hypothetical protein HMPREF0083_04432 [Aneurinibacillus aneurinilyticus ATCC 12856]